MRHLFDTVHIYRGATHPGLTGWIVVVTGVIRDEELLTRPEDVGELQEGDLLEVRPIIDKRLSFVSYDAAYRGVEDLGAPWPGEGGTAGGR